MEAASDFDPSPDLRAKPLEWPLGALQLPLKWNGRSGGRDILKVEPGGGTSVEVYLPRSIEKAADEPWHENALPLRRSASGEVVLVIQDEPAALEMAVESLGELGYRMLTANRASEALERLVH